MSRPNKPHASDLRDGWQPLDSAPRDGTQFLAVFGREVLLVRWDRGWELGPMFPSPPSHWMPLPKPPTEATA
jgi:hypothetical protein